MDWSAQLEPGEMVSWQGRPAPRCYVFRHWRHSVLGIFLLILSIWWQAVGVLQGHFFGWIWLAWLPLPFVLIGFYSAIGHLLLSRLEWEHVYYALTDRRLLVQRGLFRRRVASLHLNELENFQLCSLGENLGTLRVSGGKPVRILLLCCIEYPRQVADRLEAELASQGES
jgi:hypothetical protein